MTYSYLIAGMCEKDGVAGAFFLSVDAQDKDEAKLTVVEELQAAGYTHVVAEKSELQRRVSAAAGQAVMETDPDDDLGDDYYGEVG
jgi:hypothetical protein